MKPAEKIIVALDVKTVDEAIAIVQQLAPFGVRFKVGLQLIMSMFVQYVTLTGIEGANEAYKARKLFMLLGNNFMFDPKFHDIANTVKGAMEQLGAISPALVTVHASNSLGSLRAATEVKGNSQVLGVTVLTDLDDEECVSLFRRLPRNQVLYLAGRLERTKVDGIVCSYWELKALKRDEKLQKLVTVIPAIRPLWYPRKKDDQARPIYPAQAIKAGADYLVIGRPITNPLGVAGGPVEALDLIVDEIAEVM